MPKGENPGGGWIIDEKKSNRLKTKDVYIMPKSHSKQLEHDIWCLFYKLGFQEMSLDENLFIPLENNDEDQLDVFAVDHSDEIAYIVECKSKESKGKLDFKNYLQTIDLKIHNYLKSIRELC